MLSLWTHSSDTAMSRSGASPEVININTPADASPPTTRPTSSVVEDKLLQRYTSNLLAETSKIKLEQNEHGKRLNFLRREAEKLEKTDWQYEKVETLLGK